MKGRLSPVIAQIISDKEASKEYFAFLFSRDEKRLIDYKGRKILVSRRPIRK